MITAVLAEKPSVARDLARTLGATTRGEGYLEGNGYVVTWAVGHLVRLAEPQEMNPGWKRWSRALLPMIPREWPLQVIDKTKDQFQAIRKIFRDPQVKEVICATDAGREGELIFRLIYEAAGCRKPVRRLWLSSLTDSAIRQAFRQLRDGKAMEPLADAARGRSRADWLVGMNLSRAYTLGNDDLLSVGRVQTPTLAMVVERELAIRDFVPEAYLEVVATFSPGAEACFPGTWFRWGTDPGGKRQRQTRLPPDGAEAKAILERVRGGAAAIASVRRETKRMPPPLLYDLTELQRHANRLFGFTAQKTLQLAQALYEQHKVLSYPRTDSRHLSETVASTLPSVVEAIRDAYAPHLAAGTGERPLGRRYVDDAKVTDHHALIPTSTKPGSLPSDERKIYDLVCRRLLQAWHDDFVWAATTVLTEVTSAGATDRFHSVGTAIEQAGWKVLDLGGEKRAPRRDAEDGEDEGRALPAGLSEGQRQQVVDVKEVPKKTRPPPRLTDATLLTAMETAGKTLDEKELSEAMKGCGLGTPATRAAIIETLLAREYLVRQGKTFAATDKGISLIETVDPEVKSPLMTGQWEARLQRIERGEGRLGEFVTGIEDYVRRVIERMPARPTRDALPEASTASLAPRVREPTPPSALVPLLQRTFGHPAFRPHQEAVCRAATEGRDVLLVMPTGAGKSLCYQLPGLARAGTTVVVSPLIALMEDQVAALRRRGLEAERIHSGRDRQSARQVCRDYLEGKLDFLFIAPERLGVPGFLELLAKRTPALVAIDEAHCISQWGHDFRPDYRLLGQRLPLLRPAPVIAVTATATPRVQEDIIAQLGLSRPERMTHGFRRTNLAIEVQEVAPSERIAHARRLLALPERLPAILYAPTRKRAEEVAEALSSDHRIAAYHAGLSAAARDRIQTSFLGGELDVVVATIAFGMGVDKADVRTVLHLALPSTVEGYYQEIGRAGRDGLESRAILLHSWADRRTHEFFLERDYPEPAILEQLFALLGLRPAAKETLRRKLRVKGEVLEKALEKLWMHGGARVTPDEEVTRGEDGWRPAYVAQREHRREQLEKMSRYAGAHGCRMVHLVQHFGDRDDTGRPCGLCDVCAPERCVAVGFRGPSAEEFQVVKKILAALWEVDRQGTGRLCRELLGEAPAHRRMFDRLAGGLVRAGLVQLSEDAFEKEGRLIAFQRISLTPEGRRAGEGIGQRVRLVEDVNVEAGGGSARGKRGKGKTRRGAKPVMPRTEASAPGMVEALRTWRLGEAKRRRVPAFRIFSDRVLLAIAAARPASTEALLRISGVGPKLVERSGSALVALCAGEGPGHAPE